MQGGPRPSPRRVLDPVERFTEVLFGLIMVLTCTGSLSAAEAGRAEVRAMRIGALGCNLAWGVIDGILYLMGAWPTGARASSPCVPSAPARTRRRRDASSPRRCPSRSHRS